MIHYRLTSALLALIIAVVIIFMIRRDRMQPRYATWWLTTALAVLIFGFFPKIIDFLGHLLGISYPPILLIIVAIGFFLIKILRMDLDRSAGERRLRRLTQRLAILEETCANTKDDKLSGTQMDEDDKKDK